MPAISKPHKSIHNHFTYRIAETSGSLLGKDGTGGDGPAEKLGDVGQSGATIGSGLEGGGRFGREESGRGHDGGGKNEAGHDFAYCIDICGKGSVKQTDLGFTKSNREADVEARGCGCEV